MFQSLNTRLLLSHIALVLVCLALVGLGLLLFLRTSPLWTEAAWRRLEAAEREVLNTLLERGRDDPLTPEALRALVDRTAEAQGVRVLLVDGAATVQYDSGGGFEGERLAEVAAARPVQGQTRGTFIAPSGGRWAYVGRAIPGPAQERQSILFALPPRRLVMLKWYVENILPSLLRAGVAALFLSILLALLISRSVSRPLQRVAGAAQAIARGESDTRAPVGGPAEVRALADSFNAMAGQVEAAQQSQRDFVANVSHELKTPLTSVQGFSQALLDGTAAGPEAVAKAARVIHEEADRMRRLVEDLLVLARFDAGEVRMAQEPLDLGALLQGCVEKLAPQAEAAQVTLALKVGEQLFVTGDGDRLAQVMANLVDNALAHTPAGGKVTLAARRVAGRRNAPLVELVVTDTGEGIPAEVVSRIFERFYQVDKSRRRHRGAGLGLAITKEIVEAHGGTIAVESVEGLGSKFTLHLPYSRAAAAQATTVISLRRKETG